MLIRQLIFMLAIGLAFSVQAEIVKHSELTYYEVIESDALVVDIREPWEWEDTGVLPNSELITLDSGFIQRVKEVHDPGQTIIIVCRTGSRTSQMASYIAKNFDVKVISLHGGIQRLITEIGTQGLKPFASAP